MKIKLTSFLLCSSLLSSYAIAHAEHDRARFVSPDGQDKGKCDTPVRPCQSIAYAATQAKKGDKVLVASGNYTINTADELLALTSSVVPVLGGFNRFDHYLNQAPTLHTTTLYGVPEDYALALHNRGFHVVQDGIAQNLAAFNTLKRNETELSKAHSATSCSNGKAGSFNCQNIDLVAHMPLTGFSQKPGSGSDIWGHIDLNDNTEYAIMGFNNGVAVVSLKNPEAPQEVGFISGINTSWRDIKVYQYYSESQKRWLAYAYVTSESGLDGVMIVDLSNLPTKVSLVKSDFASNRAHNLYISNIDYGLNISLDDKIPTLHLVGENTGGGAYRNFSLSEPKALSPASPVRLTNRADYTHDAASLWVKDTRAQRDCKNATLEGCQVLLDFNEQEMRLWDISDKNDHNELSSSSYPQAEYIHSGWASEDGQYVFVHDELDEQRHSLKTTVRVFDIANLTAPTLVKEWVGPTAAIDHNGYVKGNRYYMSNYQRGLTVLDITNPKEPTEIGYFDTYPNSDGAQFNGAWGTYPFLPSGLVLVSDINSGLYILKDNTKASNFGMLSLPTSPLQLADGDNTITIPVTRSAGSEGKVSVDFDILAGNTSSDSVQHQSNKLEWEDGDSSAKTITVPIELSNPAQQHSFFVRLRNTQGGATLGTNIVRVNIGQKPAQVGYADFAQTTLRVLEDGQSFSIEVHRLNGDEQALTVNYAFEASAANDIEGTLAGEINWPAGDSASKTLTFKTINDSQEETDETFELKLTGQSVGANHTLSVQILDDEANKAPVIYLSQSYEANTRQLYTLTANVSDDNNDAVTLLWTQTSGTTVQLSDVNTTAITFQTPETAGELGFMLSATDERGAVTEHTVVVKVIEPTTTPPPVNPPATEPNQSSSSGGGMGLFLITLLPLLRRRIRV